jgi:hypothetical protein
MSLTSALDDSNSLVHRFMRDRFPNVAAVRQEWRSALQGATTVAPTVRDWPWAQIGTAIDYRIRFYFAPSPLGDLVAAQGCRLLASQSTRWADRVLGFAEYLGERLKALEPTQRRLNDSGEAELNRICFVLALLDEPYRSGLVSPLLDELPSKADLVTLTGSIRRDWIDDLCVLSRTFATSQRELLAQRAVCNPTFLGSRSIGGADADLIADRCLIEIKTNKKPKASWQTLYQLVGYVLLDRDDAYELDSVAVYLTRQATLVRWSLPDYLNRLAGQDLDVGPIRDTFWKFAGFAA